MLDFFMNHNHHEENPIEYIKFFALISAAIIVGIIIGLAQGNRSIMTIIPSVIGSMLIMFGIFKVSNFNGFITAFKRYDLFAKTIPYYAEAYPFIELTLGILFLIEIALLPISIVTAVIMFFATISVVTVIRSNDMILCACLGGIVKLPVTKITVVENSGMLLMSIMIVIYSLP